MRLMPMTYDVTDFEREVLERSRELPVLADFWASWCGPCRVLSPVLERLAGEPGVRWTLAKINTEEFSDLAERYSIASIPNVKLFVNGEVVDEFVGALPEPAIREWLRRALPSPHAAEVEQAARDLEAGAYDTAAAALRPIVSSDPHDARARVLLGRALLHTEPSGVDAVVRHVPFDSPHSDAAEALALLARVALLADAPAGLPESPARAGLLAGATALRRGDFAAALEALIGSVRADRDYAEGLAREAGRAVFVLLGLEHPISERFHRAFSSALYS